MQVQFGVGNAVGRRLDGNGIWTPAWMGVLQEIDFDFDQALVELFGQNKFAVDVAPGPLKITGKLKFAQLYAANYSNLFFGSSAVETTGSGWDMTLNEAHTMAAATYQVSGHANYVSDMGVFYAATGLQLDQVAAGSEATGAYSVAPATGTYTFAVGDQTAALLFFYTVTITSAKQLVVSNTLMGTGSTFELNISAPYNVAGVAKKFNIRFNACRAAKMSHALKNKDYMVPEMDFQAFADPTGKVLTWALTE